MNKDLSTSPSSSDASDDSDHYSTPSSKLKAKNKSQRNRHSSQSSNSDHSSFREISFSKRNEMSDESDSSGSSQGDGNDDCAICLERMRGEVGSPDECDHVFCLDCILEWSKNNAVCPQDRKSFKGIKVHSSFKGPFVKEIPVEKHRNSLEDELFLYEDELSYCEVCNRSDGEDRMLLCDGCDLGYHLECLTPPLSRVPIEEWFCPSCAAANVPERLNLGRSSSKTSSTASTPHTSSTKTSSSNHSRPSDSGTRPRLIPRTRQAERIRKRISHRRSKRKERHNKPGSSRKKALEMLLSDDEDEDTAKRSSKRVDVYGSINDNDVDAQFNDDDLAEQLLCGSSKNSGPKSQVEKKFAVAQKLREMATVPLTSYRGSKMTLQQKLTSPVSSESLNVLDTIINDQSLVLSRSKDLLLTEDRKLIKKTVSEESSRESKISASSSVEENTDPSNVNKLPEKLGSPKMKSKSGSRENSVSKSSGTSRHKSEYSSKSSPGRHSKRHYSPRRSRSRDYSPRKYRSPKKDKYSPQHFKRDKSPGRYKSPRRSRYRSPSPKKYYNRSPSRRSRSPGRRGRSPYNKDRYSSSRRGKYDRSPRRDRGYSPRRRDSYRSGSYRSPRRSPSPKSRRSRSSERTSRSQWSHSYYANNNDSKSKSNEMHSLYSMGEAPPLTTPNTPTASNASNNINIQLIELPESTEKKQSNESFNKFNNPPPPLDQFSHIPPPPLNEKTDGVINRFSQPPPPLDVKTSDVLSQFQQPPPPLDNKLYDSLNKFTAPPPPIDTKTKDSLTQFTQPPPPLHDKLNDTLNQFTHPPPQLDKKTADALKQFTHPPPPLDTKTADALKQFTCPPPPLDKNINDALNQFTRAPPPPLDKKTSDALNQFTNSLPPLDEKTTNGLNQYDTSDSSLNLIKLNYNEGINKQPKSEDDDDESSDSNEPINPIANVEENLNMLRNNPFEHLNNKNDNKGAINDSSEDESPDANQSISQILKTIAKKRKLKRQDKYLEPPPTVEDEKDSSVVDEILNLVSTDRDDRVLFDSSTDEQPPLPSSFNYTKKSASPDQDVDLRFSQGIADEILQLVNPEEEKSKDMKYNKTPDKSNQQVPMDIATTPEYDPENVIFSSNSSVNSESNMEDSISNMLKNIAKKRNLKKQKKPCPMDNDGGPSVVDEILNLVSSDKDDRVLFNNSIEEQQPPLPPSYNYSKKSREPESHNHMFKTITKKRNPNRQSNSLEPSMPFSIDDGNNGPSVVDDILNLVSSDKDDRVQQPPLPPSFNPRNSKVSGSYKLDQHMKYNEPNVELSRNTASTPEYDPESIITSSNSSDNSQFSMEDENTAIHNSDRSRQVSSIDERIKSFELPNDMDSNSPESDDLTERNTGAVHNLTTGMLFEDTLMHIREKYKRMKEKRQNEGGENYKENRKESSTFNVVHDILKLCRQNGDESDNEDSNHLHFTNKEKSIVFPNEKESFTTKKRKVSDINNELFGDLEPPKHARLSKKRPPQPSSSPPPKEKKDSPYRIDDFDDFDEDEFSFDFGKSGKPTVFPPPTPPDSEEQTKRKVANKHNRPGTSKDGLVISHRTSIQKQALEVKVVDEVKKWLDPYYKTKAITKDVYKEIVAKCVYKVVSTEHSDTIDSRKMKNLVAGYVKVYKHRLRKLELE